MNTKQTNKSLEVLNARKAVLTKAFVLADPSCPSIGADWKGEIRFSGTKEVLEKCCASLGVTFDDVLESIEFFTATRANVTTVGNVVTVTADGYRKGPAGDH